MVARRSDQGDGIGHSSFPHFANGLKQARGLGLHAKVGRDGVIAQDLVRPGGQARHPIGLRRDRCVGREG